MEAIVFFALILVVAVKAFTIHSLQGLESKIRGAQSDEADVSSRLGQTESSLRSLEKEHKALEQEIKHLENDKDLATLEVSKAGGRPLTEEQLDQLLNAMAAPKPANNKATAQKAAPTPKKDESSAPASESQTNEAEDTSTDPNVPPAPQLGASQAVERAPASNGTVATTQATDTASNPEDTHDDPTPDEQNQNAANEPNAPAPEADKRHRILVVDDNDELRNLLLQALSKDYEVLEAPDGFQALSQILKHKEVYDLIITDLNMPKVNGITLLEHLPEGIPTIVISAFLNKPEFKKALAKYKPYSVLEKPFQMATLRTAIQEAIASKTPEPDPSSTPSIST